MTILSLLLDLVLATLLGVGIFYAVRLTRQLSEMRANHLAMERFVTDFNATVLRAEAGIRGLKNAARQAGDDLEHLIEKGQSLRDELHFLTESADQIAARLSDKAASATRGNAETKKEEPAAAAKTAPPAREEPPKPSSAAERELLNLLKKSGG